MGYLNTEGLKRLWTKIQKLKQDKLTPDKSITITDENEIKVSLPTVYLTLSEYQRLSDEEKNRDILYVTNGSPPVKDDNFHPNDYSTEETVIGTWLGKPLYRRAFENLPCSESNTSVFFQNEDWLYDIDCVNIYGMLFDSNDTLTNYLQTPIPNNKYTFNFIKIPPTSVFIRLDVSSTFNVGQTVNLVLEYVKKEEG